MRKTVYNYGNKDCIIKLYHVGMGSINYIIS